VVQRDLLFVCLSEKMVSYSVADETSWIRPGLEAWVSVCSLGYLDMTRRLAATTRGERQNCRNHVAAVDRRSDAELGKEVNHRRLMVARVRTFCLTGERPRSVRLLASG
jgi:hypothetical protein